MRDGRRKSNGGKKLLKTASEQRILGFLIFLIDVKRIIWRRERGDWIVDDVPSRDIIESYCALGGWPEKKAEQETSLTSVTDLHHETGCCAIPYCSVAWASFFCYLGTVRPPYLFCRTQVCAARTRRTDLPNVLLHPAPATLEAIKRMFYKFVERITVKYWYFIYSVFIILFERGRGGGLLLDGSLLWLLRIVFKVCRHFCKLASFRGRYFDAGEVSLGV